MRLGLRALDRQAIGSRRSARPRLGRGYGTSCYWDPATGVIGVLLTQRLMDSPSAPPGFVDFWRSTYEAAGA